MTKRTLMITMTPDWPAALRAAGKRATSRSYQGEVLNFESAGRFFGKLTERHWELIHALQGQGPMTVRELARRVARDLRRVHGDVEVLAELGLVERTASGGVECPFEVVHIDMRMAAPQPCQLNFHRGVDGIGDSLCQGTVGRAGGPLAQETDDERV